MVLSGPHISRFALSLFFCTFLTPRSPGNHNVPPAQAPQTPLALTPQQQTQLHDLAARVLQHADKAGCKKGYCTILVANFTVPSGVHFHDLGMQLADQVSKELAAQQAAIKIVDRSRLQSFLEEQRIPAALFKDEKAICWLGKHLGADTVLRGTTER